MLILGGAGFIGCNAAHRFAGEGWRVTIFDNLSRAGTASNLDWLRQRHNVGFVKGDIRDREAVDRIFAARAYDAVLHLAAQVAVTTSVADPRADFETNALGTLNVLEGARAHCPQVTTIFASTNKVYGRLDELPVAEREGRYAYADGARGIGETQQLDFHSPYGCSKGAADQYVIDYARIYGMNSTSFRQSCIYGPRQFGVEDQGWVAWFAIAALLERKLTIYGDGKQVRDVLHVDDLIDAYRLAIEHPQAVRGQAFNVGGGPDETLSLLELLAMLEARLGRRIAPDFADWRAGDQRIYVSDISRIGKALGWSPRIAAAEGVGQLIDWVGENRGLFG